MAQIRQTYQMTKQSDPRIGLILLGWFLLPIAVAAVICFLIGSWWLMLVGVSTGAEALTRFREDVTAWTIVVSDLLMPDVDGATTVDQLRGLNPKQPALFVSGYSAGHGTEPDVRTGFISKPFTADALTAELARLVPHAVVQGIGTR